MFLQKIEIQGFKSFAHKTVLEFNRELTAIVGPNGSGKSNVADAIRWVLGEQSFKLLRGKRAEDIIFAGSDKKARAGMAEVSIYLNNEAGQAPIEYSEVVITRRVFRDGQNEYLLNQSLVRLQDILLLLARANVGQKTYSVIGQGMIDSVLLASPAERKEFFEEATGVKQYQIKREQSINKLINTYENLEQAKVLVQEIEPRLRVLARQVKRLEKREELETALRQQQKKYYRYRFHQLDELRQRVKESWLNNQEVLTNYRAKVRELHSQLENLGQASPISKEWQEWQQQQSKLRDRLNNLMKERALGQVEQEVAHLKRGEGEIVLLKQRRQELGDDLKQLGKRRHNLQREIETVKQNIQVKLKEQAQLISLFGELGGTAHSDWWQNELKLLWEAQVNLKIKLASVKTVSQTHELVGLAAEIAERLHIILLKNQKSDSGKSSEFDKYLEQRDRLASDIGALQARILVLQEQIEDILEQEKKYQAAQIKLDSLIQRKGKSGSEERDLSKIQQQIDKIELELSAIEQNLNLAHTREEIVKTELLRLQRELDLARKLEQSSDNKRHELELEKTRIETKLEDLEREMALEAPLELVHEIKMAGETELIDEGVMALEIKKLKGQLELTGGIEPEVVVDYEQTKARFDFLTTQIADLEQATRSLETIIHDLDDTIEKRFLVSLKSINEKFGEYFKVLFSGGRAQLVLQKSEPIEIELPSEAMAEEGAAGEVKPLTAREKFLASEKVKASLFSGVEIQATPPGKKLSGITALSGGEKALASIALICAIISFRPSPFIVLDEVDAALDESNSERFATILETLMKQTQFIIITHNRATMKRAAVLYGVTMGNDGVSKLLSVKLEEAKEIVNRNPKT